MLMDLTVNAINVTSNKEIVHNLFVADTIFLRMKGLLGKNSLRNDEGLWIKPCKGVHTFGMKFPIDVLFLDRNNLVIAIKKELAPNRMTLIYPRAITVIELSSGMIEATATKIGNQIMMS